jgi:hypothetical protein
VGRAARWRSAARLGVAAVLTSFVAPVLVPLVM